MQPACWWVTSLFIACGLFLRCSHAKGPGLAFPISSENFAIETFRRTNPSIVSIAILQYFSQRFNGSSENRQENSVPKTDLSDSYIGWPKNGTVFWYALTSSNINRFSKLCHSQNQEKMYNNTITEDPTKPQTCCYTTL